MISILEHIEQDFLDELCQKHFDEILVPSDGYRYKIKDALEVLAEESVTKRHRTVVESIIFWFEDFILSRPDELEILIDYFDDKGYNLLIKMDVNFRNKIAKAFNYKNYRGGRNALRLAQGLDLKSCPYCNAQYTLVTKDTGRNKLAFQLDHFYPKSLFPYLSMSFYNLIPTCGTCNNSKGDEYCKIADSYHPNVKESLTNDLTFITDNLNIAEAYLKKKVDYNIFIKDEESLSVKTSAHISDFFIKELYARHNDIIEELVWKKYIYTEKYKQSLIDIYFDDHRLSKAELERLIVSNYTEKQDTHKRPLSKFTTDIARDLGLIK